MAMGTLRTTLRRGRFTIRRTDYPLVQVCKCSLLSSETFTITIETNHENGRLHQVTGNRSWRTDCSERSSCTFPGRLYRGSPTRVSSALSFYQRSNNMAKRWLCRMAELQR